jgi:hypothetical protein
MVLHQRFNSPSPCRPSKCRVSYVQTYLGSTNCPISARLNLRRRGLPLTRVFTIWYSYTCEPLSLACHWRSDLSSTGREHNEDESTSQLLITSLLVLATGFEPSKEALERGRGTQLITRQGLHRAGFEEALYEVMRQMELSADRLLRQSELAERDQGRYRIIVHRLIQLTRYVLSLPQPSSA